MEMTSQKNCLQITTLLPIYHHYKINSHYHVNNKFLVTNKVRSPGVLMLKRDKLPSTNSTKSCAQ